MYTYIWNKYFPVIRILVKRSANAEQMLDLNRIDFERSGKGRKAVYKFNIEFVNGRPATAIMDDELAQTLASILMEDDITKVLLLQNNYEFRFTTKFQLHIKNMKKQPQTFAGTNKYNRRTSVMS
jgi:hypothetical protein